jgi:poly-gamma-glutamate capsule biosynthesis protein CapA/YwtB (metallophosphatase superfamily)
VRRAGRWGPSLGGLLTTVALVVALVGHFPGSSAARPEVPVELGESVAEPREPAAEPGEPVAELVRFDAPVLADRAAPETLDEERPAPPVILRIGLGPGEGETRAAIDRWLGPLWSGYEARFDAEPHEPLDVIIGDDRPPAELEATLLGTTHWVVAAHFTSDLEDVSVEDLRAAFRGERTSWAELDGPPVRIAPVLVAGSRGVGAAALGLRPEELGDVDVTAPADFPARAADLARERGILLVLPLGLADPRFHPLTVDGSSPLLQRGSESRYPLKLERWVGLRREAFAEGDWARFRSELVHVLTDGSPSAPWVTTVTAAGDIIFGRKVDQKLQVYGDYTRPFHVVGDELRRADLTVANLECTLSDNVRPPHDWGTFAFGSSTRAIEGLRLGGIDVVSLANNHSRDMGIGPFGEMLDALRAEEIGYVGAGRDPAEAHAPHIVDVRGTRFAFLGYDEIGSAFYGVTDQTPGTAAMSEEAVRRDVAAARERADVVIPFFHWGVEYTNRPTERQRRVARAAVEAGAAMVLGSHPHWVQAVEFYEGAFIAYGLGNFIFDQDWSIETLQGVIMQTSFVDGRLASIRFLPIQIEDLHQPRIVDRAAGRPILERMFSVSEL